MPALQAIVQMCLIVALSASHVLLWPAIVGGDCTWATYLVFAVNWSALVFFFYSLAHIMHEGAHHHLSRNRWLNEILFCVAGMPVLGAPSLFRAVHFRHHGFTNQFDDLALLPQIKAHRLTKRRKRRIAMLVLFAGILNGASYFRHLRNTDTGLDRKTRRRAWLELSIALPLLFAMAAGWSNRYGMGSFVVGFLMPTLFASWLHGWQELCEHYGMQEGATAAASRSVVARNPLARAVYWLLFNFNYHAVHHHWPYIPARHLPAAHDRYTDMLLAKGEPSPPIFGGYLLIIVQHVAPQLVRDFFSTQTTGRDPTAPADSVPASRGDVSKAA